MSPLHHLNGRVRRQIGHSSLGGGALKSSLSDQHDNTPSPSAASADDMSGASLSLAGASPTAPLDWQQYREIAFLRREQVARRPDDWNTKASGQSYNIHPSDEPLGRALLGASHKPKELPQEVHALAQTKGAATRSARAHFLHKPRAAGWKVSTSSYLLTQTLCDGG